MTRGLWLEDQRGVGVEERNILAELMRSRHEVHTAGLLTIVGRRHEMLPTAETRADLPSRST